MALAHRLTAVLVLALLPALLSGCITINALRGQREALQESVVHGKSGAKLLLLDIDGAITDADGASGLGIAGRESTVARVREQLDKARDRGDIRGLILRVNSPGGSVTASDIVYHEIRAFKAEQGVPVVAELMGVAASGGYYVAMAADEVIAHPTTVTGSIGVIFSGLNVSGLMDKVGVSNQTITSGPNKDVGSPLRPMTQSERKLLQGLVDDFQARFVSVVAEGRTNLTPEQVQPLADGRVYTASQALEAGLVDSVGYLEAAVTAASKRAGLSEARVVSYHRPREWRENLYSASAEAEVPTARLDLEALFGVPMSPGFHYLWWPSF